MAEARAEDLRSLAAVGIQYSRYLFLDYSWRSARRMRGPHGRQGLLSFGPRSMDASRRRAEHAAPWIGERPLGLTVASTLEGAAAEVVDRLLAVSRLGPATVDTAPAFGPVTYPSVGRISMRRNATTGGAVVATSRRPGFQAYTEVHPSLLDVLTRSDSGSPVAEQLILDMACHDALANDLFVTTDPELLERRWSDGWGAGVGICDPLEAIGLVEALLRSRRRFVLQISEKSTTGIDSTGFYADLVRHRLPTLHRALASCLSPSRRDAARPIASMAESIASRYRDLLIAQDSLFRLAQVEGYLGGSNNLNSEQMYHVQNSLVLFSGTLDVLADVAREIQGQAVHRHEVSWTRLLSVKGWGSKLSNSSAVAMRREAARLHVDQCIPTVLLLRNAYGHSAPLRSGVAEFHDEYGLTKACYTLISLSDSLDASPPLTDKLSGLLHIGSKLFLIPHVFQQGLVASLAEIINGVLGVTDWPDDDWVEREPDAEWSRIQAEYRWRSERAGWLFRP